MKEKKGRKKGHEGRKGRKGGRKGEKVGRGRVAGPWLLVHVALCAVFSRKRLNAEIAEMFSSSKLKTKTKNTSELLFFRRKRNVSPAL